MMKRAEVISVARKMILIKFSFVLLLLLIGSILFFAFAPGQWTPAWIVNHDKFSHMVVFFILSFMLSMSFPLLRLSTHLLAMLSIAVLIELVQLLFAERGFSIEDLVYDVLGIFIFYALVFWAKNRNRLKRVLFGLVKN